MVRAASLGLLLTFTALTACAAAAGEPRGIHVWACPDAVKVSPEGKLFNRDLPPDYRLKNSVWDGRKSTIRLAGARNEWVAFQLQISTAPDADLRDVDVRVTPPWGAGAEVASFALYREHYTEVKVPSESPGPSMGRGWYPDALIPFRVKGHGAPFAIHNGRTQGVWVDCHILPNAPAGRWRGEVHVSAEGSAPVTMPLELDVFAFTIPDKMSCRINATTYDLGKGGHAINSGWKFKFDVWSEKFWRLERQFYRMAREHRIVIHSRNYELPARKLAGGGLEIDWSRFDARWGCLFDGTAYGDRRPLNYWEVSVGRNVRERDFGGKRSEAYGRAVGEFCGKFAAHFRKKGWTKTKLVAFPVDEPSRADAFDRAQFLAREIKKGAPEIEFRIDIYKALTKQRIDRFKELIDIWAIQGSFFRGLLYDLKKLQKDGVEVWFYQGSGPAIGAESIDAEGLDLRTWPWICWRYGLEGCDLWECCKWQQLTKNIWTDPHNQPWKTNSPGVLFYPGHNVGLNEPIPSMRLKMLRRGELDYEYMKMLADLGRTDEADRICRSIMHAALDQTKRKHKQKGDWSHDPAEWHAARLSLAKAILEAKAAGKKP